MKAYVEDIICAEATPHGVGALSVVRVSGKNSLSIFSKILKQKESFFEPNKSTYHKVYDEDSFLDEVLVSYFKEGKSFTGEESFEVSTHGSPLIVSSFLKLFSKHGVRLAEPGEFSFRAYLNGKMDLTKAEGIHYTIQAKSELAKSVSLNLLEGSFKKNILSIKEDLVWAASRVEASIDFSDQDIDLNHDDLVFDKIKQAEAAVGALLKTYEVGAVQSKGVSVALCGPPNAGKSTLFNILLDEERSIVSDQAGTTRDYISQTLMISGHPVNLIDTAGLRVTDQEIEADGIKRSVKIAKESQLILFLVSEDSQSDVSTFFTRLKDLNIPIVVIHTKQDVSEWSSELEAEKLFFSKGSKSALDALYGVLAEKLSPYLSLNRNLFVDRHRELMAQSSDYISQLSSFSEISGSEDVISSLLYSSIEFLDEILYIEDPEAVRNKIFKDFCLGK